jgi:uncharacterized protein
MNARLLLSAALPMMFLSTPALATVSDLSTPSIAVTGESEVRIVPDEVFFNVAIVTLDKDVTVAARDNDVKLRKLLATAKEFGVPAAMIQTGEMSIRHRENMSQALIGFEVRKSVSICLKDLSKFESLLSALVKSGVNDMPGIEFRSTKMEDARTKARLQAVKVAKSKATAMAGELGEKIGRPLKISEAPVSFQRFAYVDAASSQSHEGFAPGEIGVSVSVSVEFALTGS